MAGKDIERVNLFLSDFVQEMTAAFPEEIDYICIAGSVNRGDFIIGESDIDLTVRIKEGYDVSPIERFGNEVFWRLDEKYGTGVLDAYRKKFPRASNREKFRPLYVYAPGTTGRWTPFRAASPLLGFKKSLLRHAKISGRVLYGRDFLKDVSLEEKNPFRILFTYALFTSLTSLLMFPFSPDRCLRRSICSVIYTFEDELYDKKSRNHAIAKDALEAKINFQRIKKGWSYLKKASYCFRVFIIISSNNIRNLFHHFSGGGFWGSQNELSGSDKTFR